MNKPATALALLALACSCSRHVPQQYSAPAVTARDGGSLQAPTGRLPTVDPKSTQAAVDLARAFAALLNARQFNEAYMLLGANAPVRTRFDDDFSHVSNLRVRLGAAGLQEGAAGSTYVSIPLTLSGKNDRNNVSRSGTLLVRRVNDVPGSTEAQRHWHIDRIDWRTDA